jgi:hypothetical protein
VATFGIDLVRHNDHGHWHQHSVRKQCQDIPQARLNISQNGEANPKEEFSRKCDAEREERERLGVKYPGTEYADPEMVWERSFVARESDGLPLELRLFGIGSKLAELIVDLKQPTEERSLIDQLSRGFGNLREIVHLDDSNRALVLAKPAIDRFCDTLADVADARNGLVPKCEDLCQRLQRFFKPLSQRAALGSGDDGIADDGIPF